MDAETETRRAVPWLAVGSLYLAGMLQGLTLVSFPASSAVLKQMHGFSDAQYGTIFLPQVALAVIGALGGGALASRLGLKALLGGALLINALSQLLLAGSMLLPPALAFASVLLGTACLGLGFGAAGAPLNGLPPLFFPPRRDSALVALHTLLGLGLTVGPLVASPFIMSGRWAGFPLLLAALCALTAVSAFVLRFPEDGSERPLAPASGPAAMADPMPLPSGIRRTPDEEHPVRTAGFWLFMAIAVLYAFAEGTFGNWAVLYLQDVKHQPETVAASALSVFWAAMVGGRLLTSVLVLKLAPPLHLAEPARPDDRRLPVAALRRYPLARHRGLCAGRAGLLGVLPAQYRARHAALRAARTVGILDADRRADGGRGPRLLCHRRAARCRGHGTALPAVDALSRHGPAAGRACAAAAPGCRRRRGSAATMNRESLTVGPGLMALRRRPCVPYSQVAGVVRPWGISPG